MSYTYEFSREFGDTIHSDPNTFNIGHLGEPIRLCDRVKQDLGKACKVRCNASKCYIEFQEALNANQQSALLATVNSQKAQNDWPLVKGE